MTITLVPGRSPGRTVFAGLALATLLTAGAVRAETPQLSSLHDGLHLTAEQESGWRRYVASIRPDAQAEARHGAAQRMMATLSTPRRVDLINAEVDEDAQAVHRQGEAVKAFYATLTPAQQRAFDRQTAQLMAIADQHGGDEDATGLGSPSNGQLPPPQGAPGAGRAPGTRSHP